MLLTKKNMKAIRAEQEEKHREATRSLRKLRVEQMYEQRASGMSFQEIATNFGVTRERVRQILAEFPELKAESTKAREAEKWAEVLDHADEIDASFMRTHKKSKVIEEFPFITAARMNRYLTERFPLHPSSRSNAGHWSVEELVGFLQEAAASRHSLSVNDYRKWSERVRSEGRRVPVVLTVVTRFGQWNEAIRQAGLEPKERYNEYRVWSDEDVESIMRSFISYQIEHAERISITNFDKWLLEQPVGSVPSSGLFRNRIPNWAEYVDVALVEMQTTHQTNKQKAEAND